MLRILVLTCTVVLALSSATEGTALRSEPQDAHVAGWITVIPNPCVDWGPYDVYFKVRNGLSNSVTVTKVTDNGDSVWGGSLTVPAGEARNVLSAHGDHAQAGTYVHHPVFYTSAGTVQGPEYTFEVASDGACGWFDVIPNPCQAGDPYDVYFKFYNGTASSITVTKVTDVGDSVWGGSLSVPGLTASTVLSGHGDHAQAGIWNHYPIFYTSYGTVTGARDSFLVNPMLGIAERPTHPSILGRELTCIPGIVRTATNIVFTTNAYGRAKIEIVDILGHSVRTVLDGIVAAGAHSVHWDRTDQAGHPVAAGVYICRLTTGDRSAAARVTLAR